MTPDQQRHARQQLAEVLRQAMAGAEHPEASIPMLLSGALADAGFWTDERTELLRRFEVMRLPRSRYGAVTITEQVRGGKDDGKDESVVFMPPEFGRELAARRDPPGPSL